jgi:hypothetical protein
MFAYGLPWMIVNYDILEQSHALEDRVPLGRFSQTFVEHLARNTLRIHAWDCNAELARLPREDFHIFLSA